MAMLDGLHEQCEVVQARFTGDLPSAHSIGVREATAILGSLQEVVSEVGSAIHNESPKRGPLRASILAETELQLSPHVAPGSVIFAMSPARDVTLFDASTLLADALAEVFALFDQVERPATTGGTSDSVTEALCRFLESLAENATKRTIETEITAEVHTLGRDHKYKINTEDRGRIKVQGTDAIIDVLQAAFRNSLIRLTVLETEAINPATGAVR